MKKYKILSLLIVLELLTISITNAAFCSLRDPVSAIQMLYNQNYEYRSLVTTITEEDRISVKANLPFTLHQGEVGKHTLYVIYKDGEHDGFLQARSEWAKWGLIEIAWAINADKTLRGFYFQRCRSPECNDSVVQSIEKQIKNKTFNQLKPFLSSDGESLSAAGKKAFPTAQTIALLTLRSALKTLAITNISWEKNLLLTSNQAN
ncbi:hypothetical protein [Paraglaciecola sp. 2405UD69-4]|uniref:hypothetical protein n=1 Tax=Paraglaciecola sp. 2405UD69-4 TaxID=3391836 RepID=UPI0039C9D1BA